MGLRTVDTHVTLECADGVRVGRVKEGLCKWMERPAPQCAIEAVEADQDDMYIDAVPGAHRAERCLAPLFLSFLAICARFSSACDPSRAWRLPVERETFFASSFKRVSEAAFARTRTAFATARTCASLQVAKGAR